MAQHGITSEYWIDDDGAPAGGITHGTGLLISWQNGPLGPPGPGRRAPNGASVEDVLTAAHERLTYYQCGPFGCHETAQALQWLERAMSCLALRTLARTAQGVEGTHEAHQSADEPQPRTRIVGACETGDEPALTTAEAETRDAQRSTGFDDPRDRRIDPAPRPGRGGLAARPAETPLGTPASDLMDGDLPGESAWIHDG